MSIFSLFGTPEGIENLGADAFAEGFRNNPDADLIDVRTGMEYEMGHIPGATLMDISSPAFHAQIEQLDKSRQYYVYCQSGSRSMHACKQMVKLGFERTYNLSRGVMSWREELVRSEKARQR